MNEALRQLVFARANETCEYCRLAAEFDPLPFCVDHIIAQQHHGPTVESNLACSCFSCNSCKGPNLAGIDPDTGQLTRLFHPRSDRWSEHFRWDGPSLRATTPIGRVTIYVLDINDPVRTEHRRWLIEEGSFPV
ncbi:MAG TPA: HNH endonuclease signature motif containing protein [Planctomycetaceae bacterium]|jgi:hypothetical protein